jgi:D-alanyl-lipoteichoic acid acyltransferase DltB (MBOAT superfamily)
VLMGPICRMSSMLPQFRQEWNVSDDDLRTGVRRISIGVLMAIIAEVMSGGLYPGAGIDAAFNDTARRLGGADVWCLIVAYAFQLYFSFCGYSHVVIGAARLSTTPSSFWTRWHMSMSFWIRDFVFLPLATMRWEAWWRNLSLVIAMFVFGVWHKGSFLLMMWGTYHGLLLVLHRQWQEFRKWIGFEWSGPVQTVISWALTFSAVCVGYIFFRADTLPQALSMLKAIVSFQTYPHLNLDRSLYWMTLLAAIGYFAVIGAGELLDRLAESATAWAKKAWGKKGRGVLQDRVGNFLRAVADDRWVWIAPAVIVLALYLNVIFRPGQAETGPVMYALF